jgi:hypothetical protein
MEESIIVPFHKMGKKTGSSNYYGIYILKGSDDGV